MARHRNNNLRKVCGCSRSAWPKCRHSWYVNFKHGATGESHRFSLDKYIGHHVATKTEADELLDQIKIAVREGRFSMEAPAAPPAALTIRQLGGFYADKYLALHRPRILSEELYRLNLIAETSIQRPGASRLLFGDIPAAEVKVGDVDALVEARLSGAKRKHCRCTKPEWKTCKHAWHQGRAGGRVSVNRCLARLRAVFNWGIKKGYVEATPFKIHGVTAISLFEEQERYRRLGPGEEDRLLAAACVRRKSCDHAEAEWPTCKHVWCEGSTHLRALIVAALETACRVDELLSLQWAQVRLDTKRLHLAAAKTKANRDRILPISTRLHAELEMRRLDPAGQEFKPTDYVFGNECGERVKSIKTAWRAACRRAEIEDLHFHDLRREAGSRLLESGHFGLHAVKTFLDHANISTTSRYLRAQQHDLDRAMVAYDAQRTAEATKAKKAAAATGVATAEPTHRSAARVN